jgi:hypothetical protein
MARPLRLSFENAVYLLLLANREDKLRRDYEEKVRQHYLDSEYMRTEHRKYLVVAINEKL